MGGHAIAVFRRPSGIDMSRGVTSFGMREHPDRIVTVIVPGEWALQQGLVELAGTFGIGGGNLGKYDLPSRSSSSHWLVPFCVEQAPSTRSLLTAYCQ